MGMRVVSVIVALTVAVGVSAQPAAETGMTPSERTELLDLLQKSEQELLQAITGLSDEQWAFKPGPDRWSVGEVVEHIVLADALHAARSPCWASRAWMAGPIRNGRRHSIRLRCFEKRCRIDHGVSMRRRRSGHLRR